MSSFQAEIRDACKTKIDTFKPKMVITDFSTECTYYPRHNLDDIGNTPVVSFVATGVSTSRDRVIRNTAALELSVPVQVAIQQRVELDDTATQDRLVELSEQIMDLLEDDELVTDNANGESYNWVNTEPLVDENGLVYSYEQLTVNNVFQIIFTLQYIRIKQAKLVT